MKETLIIMKALLLFFILIKISSQFTILSFIIDPRKLKVSTLSKLCCLIFTFVLLFILLLFVLTSKCFVLSSLTF
jgi:hypothetical protein